MSKRSCKGVWTRAACLPCQFCIRHFITCLREEQHISALLPSSATMALYMYFVERSVFLVHLIYSILVPQPPAQWMAQRVPRSKARLCHRDEAIGCLLEQEWWKWVCMCTPQLMRGLKISIQLCSKILEQNGKFFFCSWHDLNNIMHPLN